jgi:hypothetical protein
MVLRRSLANIRAALESHEFKGCILPILNKVQASIGGSFPMAVAELDRKLSGTSLTVSEKIALKSAMARIGLLV